MWAEHPSIAKRWAREYPNQRNLPTYAHEKNKTPEKQEASKEKEAAMAQNVTTRCADSRNTVVNYVQTLISKHANSAAASVEIPHCDKPTSAGEESISLKGPDQEGQLLGQLSNETRKTPVNETLHKLAVVLSQVIQQGIADQEAAAQGQEAAPVPQNANLSQSSQPASATPLPMGMQQAQAPAQPQQPQAGAAPVAAAPAQKAANIAPMPAGPQAAKPTAPAVGSKPGIKPIKPMAAKSMSPAATPIQSFGGLSATGEINGNAGLGVKKSPDSLKSASSPAWQRSAGKNEEGGLNEKGRKSYEREHGGNLKAPVTEKNPKGKAKARQNSFCARMCGMKSENTGASTAKDPDSRINKSLRKWNCKCSSAAQFGVKLAYLLGNQR